jgi:CRISPR system Cascade subunit CasA
MQGFDLIDQAWIPCVDLEGQQKELGLRAALITAHELREISDPSPLVTVALHRLLLAALHRVFGPATINEWEALWEGRRLPGGPLAAYLDRWRHRFDLFDPDRPFYQTAGLEEEYATSASKLLHELSSGNNATLFDHTHKDSAFVLTPPQAARAVVAHQAYGVGGLVTYRSRHGEPATAYKSADSGPLLKGAATLVRGQTLFETLLLNLHRYNRQHGDPFPSTKMDCPSWERNAPVPVVERRPEGYLDLLTWQSRRILLYASQEDGNVVVGRAAIMKGSQFPDGFTLQGRETMLCFTRRDRPQGMQDPWQPLGFSEERAIWRDSLALCQSAEATAQPKILLWVSELLGSHVLDPGSPVLIDLFGLSTDRANILLWRHERLALPAAYLEDEHLRKKLHEALRLAEDVARVLWQASSQTARLLVAPVSDRAESRQPRDEDVRPVREHFALERAYWARLANPFRRLLSELAADRVSDADGLKYGVRTLPAWAAQLRDVAHASFLGGIAGLEDIPAAIKALAAGEKLFRRELRRVLAPHMVEEEVLA